MHECEHRVLRYKIGADCVNCVIIILLLLLLILVIIITIIIILGDPADWGEL